MLKPEQTLAKIRSNSANVGRLIWIGIRPDHHEVRHMPGTTTLNNTGIEDDHSTNHEGKKRQVILIQAEHMDVNASLANNTLVTPDNPGEI